MKNIRIEPVKALSIMLLLVVFVIAYPLTTLADESLPKEILTAQLDTSQSNVHLRLGNPSNANTNDRNNYLLAKPQFVLSYNCSLGIPNWSSWQLNESWLGDVERKDNFRPDPDLPSNCYAVRPSDYKQSGYDRGHITPSADRTSTEEDNSATFVMSNMIPQSPANNRQVWGDLEEYSRDLVAEGKTLYIVAGGEGNKGALKSNQIQIPLNTWKVLIVLDSPDDQVTEDTRVIAVMIPNDESVADTNWQDYLVSVDDIEAATGLNLLSAVPDDIQEIIERRIDNE